MYRSNVDKSKLVIGFEDINRDSRNCDHDFNDLVFAVNVSSLSAIRTSNINNHETITHEGTMLWEDSRFLSDDTNRILDFNKLCYEYKVEEHFDGNYLDSIEIVLFVPYPSSHQRRAQSTNNIGVRGPKKTPKLRDHKLQLNLGSNTNIRSIFRETSSDQKIHTEQIHMNENGRVSLIDSTRGMFPIQYQESKDDATLIFKPSRVKVHITFNSKKVMIGQFTFPYDFVLQIVASYGILYDLESTKQYSTENSFLLPDTDTLRMLHLPNVVGFSPVKKKYNISSGYPHFKRYLKKKHRYWPNWNDKSVSHKLTTQIDTTFARNIEGSLWYGKRHTSTQSLCSCPIFQANITLTWQQVKENQDEVVEILQHYTNMNLDTGFVSIVTHQTILLDSTNQLQYYDNDDGKIWSNFLCFI